MNNRTDGGNLNKHCKINFVEDTEGTNGSRHRLGASFLRVRLRQQAAWMPLCLALLGSLSISACTAQSLPHSLSIPSAYVGENTSDNNTGPVRMARLSYRKGTVTWRGGTEADWSPVGNNMPLRQGAQLYVAANSKAEIQFDDGSRMRLNGNSFVTLQTLYSDNDGEFTEITLNDGQAYMRLNNKYSVYQINTPEASLKATGPARFRVGAGKGSQFAVRKGTATVEGTGGQVTLPAGEYLDLANSQSPYEPTSLPNSDSWDNWNQTRDRHYDQLDSQRLNNQNSHNIPDNIGLVGDDLGDYGTWHDDPSYGHVWAPHVSSDGWRPYRSGHWTWVDPFGWTWVASEPWGWAPYHYGTWVHQPYGWGWVPGPTAQYWSPAAVSYYQNGSSVAWCPLAPSEIRYPAALNTGFGGGNWSAFFSIGAAAVYYPTAGNYCEARPWSTSYVNHANYVNNVTNVYNNNTYNNYNGNQNNFGGRAVNRNTFVSNRNFIPANARVFGATQTSISNFGGRGAYKPVTRADFGVFTRGRAIGAPANGARAMAGPQSVPVTRQAFTPTRTFQPSTHAQQQLATRTVYRAALPTNVPRTAAPVLPGQHFTNTRTAGAAKSSLTPGRVGAGIAAGIGAAAAVRAAHVMPSSQIIPGATNVNRPTINRPTINRPAANVPVMRNIPAGASGGLKQYLQERNAGRLPAKSAPNRPISSTNQPVPNNRSIPTNGQNNRANSTVGQPARPNRPIPTVNIQARPVMPANRPPQSGAQNNGAPRTIARPTTGNTNHNIVTPSNGQRNAPPTPSIPRSSTPPQNTPRTRVTEPVSRPTPHVSAPRPTNSGSFGNQNQSVTHPAPVRPTPSPEGYRALHSGSFTPRPQPQVQQPRPQVQVQQPRQQVQQPRPQPQPVPQRSQPPVQQLHPQAQVQQPRPQVQQRPQPQVQQPRQQIQQTHSVQQRSQLPVQQPRPQPQARPQPLSVQPRSQVQQPRSQPASRPQPQARPQPQPQPARPGAGVKEKDKTR